MWGTLVGFGPRIPRTQEAASRSSSRNNYILGKVSDGKENHAVGIQCSVSYTLPSSLVVSMLAGRLSEEQQTTARVNLEDVSGQALNILLLNDTCRRDLAD
jgi:hypothetical protein